MAITWEEIKFFDEIISPGEKEIILDTEKRADAKCPYLQKDGRVFFYCGLNLPEVKNRKPSPTNPIYTKHIDIVTLQMHCLDSFETCCYYSGKIKS